MITYDLDLQVLTKHIHYMHKLFSLNISLKRIETAFEYLGGSFRKKKKPSSLGYGPRKRQHGYDKFLYNDIRFEKLLIKIL
jgi:hypothetical protein